MGKPQTLWEKASRLSIGINAAPEPQRCAERQSIYLPTQGGWVAAGNEERHAHAAMAFFVARTMEVKRAVE